MGGDSVTLVKPSLSTGANAANFKTPLCFFLLLEYLFCQSSRDYLSRASQSSFLRKKLVKEAIFQVYYARQPLGISLKGEKIKYLKAHGGFLLDYSKKNKRSLVFNATLSITEYEDYIRPIAYHAMPTNQDSAILNQPSKNMDQSICLN